MVGSEMIIVRPNNSYRYQPIIEDQRAVEPPLWHIICADFFSTEELIDQEVDLRTIPTGSEIFILDTGNNPTAQGRHTKLPMNPILYQPRWDLIDLNKYKAHDWHAKGYPRRSPYGVLYTSISCPFNCKFCFSKDFYPVGYTKRNIVDIVNDLEHFEREGVTHVKIIDEMFALDEDRVIFLCDVISEFNNFNLWCYARLDTITRPMLRSMKRAGINWVGYGIESGNEQIRKENGKGKLSNKEIEDIIKMTHDEGIKVNGNFIFGFENDDANTMQETLGLAISLKCDWINFYCLADQNVNQLSKDFLPRPTKTLSSREVLEFRDIAFSQYTGLPRLEREESPWEKGINYNVG